MPIVPPVLRAAARDLPDVPPVVQVLIGQFLAPILAWIEPLVYRPLLRRRAEHPLVLLNQWYDPAAVVAACQGYHHAPGPPGAPPSFTLEQFVRMAIVRAWAHSCSDPALEELLNTNLLVRWFIGLPLTQNGPDHATLAAFHAWLTTHTPAAFFFDTLTFLERVASEPPEAPPQIVDTFAMEPAGCLSLSISCCASKIRPSARFAMEPAGCLPLSRRRQALPQIIDTFAMERTVAACRGPAHLLRHRCLRLARCWLQHAPPHLQHASPPLDLGQLARPCYPRTAVERHQHLQTAVTLSTWSVDGLTPHLPALEPRFRAVVADYLAALAKVQADELTTDARGFGVKRADKDRGSHRLASAVDREATFCKHDDAAPAVLGTNAVLSTTTTRIRACVALTGSTPDIPPRPQFFSSSARLGCRSRHR